MADSNDMRLDDEQPHHSTNGDDYSRSNNSKFRFKSSSTSHKRRERHSKHPGRNHGDGQPHRSKRHKRTHTPDAMDEDEPSELGGLDAEAAFRESLFDAMADDEGAAYWEGVYGQPIHVYSDVRNGTGKNGEQEGGELERMTDDEYATYVRRKMFEKTHQHLLEEKARRERAKQAAREESERRQREGEQTRQESERLYREMEESLRRGQERKNRKAWMARWEAYVRGWEELGKNESYGLRPVIPWPTESGQAKDVSKEGIKKFFLYGPSAGEPTEMEYQRILKGERVRWHPDKFQQKFNAGGGGSLDPPTLQAVTAVFQIIDELWAEMRKG